MQARTEGKLRHTRKLRLIPSRAAGGILAQLTPWIALLDYHSQAPCRTNFGKGEVRWKLRVNERCCERGEHNVGRDEEIRTRKDRAAKHAEHINDADGSVPAISLRATTDARAAEPLNWLAATLHEPKSWFVRLSHWQLSSGSGGVARSALNSRTAGAAAIGDVITSWHSRT